MDNPDERSTVNAVSEAFGVTGLRPPGPRKLSKSSPAASISTPSRSVIHGDLGAVHSLPGRGRGRGRASHLPRPAMPPPLLHVRTGGVSASSASHKGSHMPASPSLRPTVSPSSPRHTAVQILEPSSSPRSQDPTSQSPTVRDRFAVPHFGLQGFRRPFSIDTGTAASGRGNSSRGAASTPTSPHQQSPPETLSIRTPSTTNAAPRPYVGSPTTQNRSPAKKPASPSPPKLVPPNPAAFLSSVLHPRKAPHASIQRKTSQRQQEEEEEKQQQHHQQTLPDNPTGASSPRPMLFFQDSDKEEAKRLGADAGSSAGGEESDSASSSAEDSSELDENAFPGDDADFSGDDGAPSKRFTAVERLGELSRDEDEYDFAILLKASRFEEHMDTAMLETMDALQPIQQLKQSLVTVADNKQDPEDKEQVSQEGDASPHKQSSACAAVNPPHVRTDPMLQHLRKQDPTSARRLIVRRIVRTGLQIKRLLSLDGKQTLLKVKAPQHVLEMGAERMRLRKLRKFDQIWMEFSCELRETFADFDVALGGVRFIDSEKQSIVHSLLTSDVTNHGDRHGPSAGAGLNEFCPLKSKYVLKMFPLHKQDLTLLRRHWVTYWRYDDISTSTRTTTAVATAVTATTLDGRGSRDDEADGSQRLTTCTARGSRLVSHALTQPLDHVAQYYGEQVAYYFAWLEMYTRWLVVPSVGGAILFAVQVSCKTLDHPLAALYALFMAVWTSAFLIAWKRRAATLAYRWGTLGYEDVERTRPEFFGDPAISTLHEKRYPAWKRYAKYGLTIPSVVVSIVLVLVLTYAAFSTRDRLEDQAIAVRARAKGLTAEITTDLTHGLTMENLRRLIELGMDWDFWFYFLITPLLYGFLIPVLDYIFTRYARGITNWENHRTESHYQSHLILKVFSFRFVHVFSSLYFYAFANASRSDSLLRVAVQLASFMVTDQLGRNVMQTLLPFVRRRLQMQRKKRATNQQFQRSTVFNTSGHAVNTKSRRMTSSTPSFIDASCRYSGMSGNPGIGGAHAAMVNNNNALIHAQCVRLEQASDRAWDEADLEEYDTFEDYTEMLIQFGYVTFFSLAFPLAPLLGLINNVLELRMDAFKLCHTKQRPIAQKASGIGIWFHVLQLLSVMAVLTNCLHLAFTTTQLERVRPGITSEDKVWIVFLAEHGILALKVWMMVVIPSMPSEVQAKVRRERDHAKLESARAMASKMQQQQQQLLLQTKTQLQHTTQRASVDEDESEDDTDHELGGDAAASTQITTL